MPTGVAAAIFIASLAGGIYLLYAGRKKKNRRYKIVTIGLFLICAVSLLYLAAVLILLGGIK